MGSHEVVQFRFSVAISITTTAAFLAMTIGVFSPTWFVVQRNGVQISEGPWYTRACPLDSGDCVISTRELIYGLHSDGRGDSGKKMQIYHMTSLLCSSVPSCHKTRLITVI